MTAFFAPLINFFVIKGFIVDRGEAIAEMSELAHTDHLTKLANRQMLRSHLENFQAHFAHHQICGALIQIGLDGFKSINDNRGHDIGDLVLMLVAKRMKQMPRTEGFISRIGGDEFVMLIPKADGDTPITNKKTMLIKGYSLQISVSMGILMLEGTRQT